MQHLKIPTKSSLHKCHRNNFFPLPESVSKSTASCRGHLSECTKIATRNSNDFPSHRCNLDRKDIPQKERNSTVSRGIRRIKLQSPPMENHTFESQCSLFRCASEVAVKFRPEKQSQNRLISAHSSICRYWGQAFLNDSRLEQASDKAGAKIPQNARDGLALSKDR